MTMFQRLKKLFAPTPTYRDLLQQVADELDNESHPDFDMLLSEYCIGGIIRKRTGFDGTLFDMIRSWTKDEAERNELRSLFWIRGEGEPIPSWWDFSDQRMAAHFINNFLETGKVDSRAYVA